MKFLRLLPAAFCLAFLGCTILSPMVWGQLTPSNSLVDSQNSETNAAANEGTNQPAAKKSQTEQFTGRFHLQQGTRQGYLVLQCELTAGSHIYSLTQTGDVTPTKIRVLPSTDFTIAGPFQPDQPPTIIENDLDLQRRVEKHKGKVQFFVPIKIREGVDLAQLRPQMILDGQVCSEQGFCRPVTDQAVSAVFAGYFERLTQQQENARPTQQQ